MPKASGSPGTAWSAGAARGEGLRISVASRSTDFPDELLAHVLHDGPPELARGSGECQILSGSPRGFQPVSARAAR